MKNFASIQDSKKQIIESLEKINDEALIHAIQNMIAYAKIRDEEFLGESIEEYNTELEKAEAEIESGNFIVHEEAMKKLGDWRNKEK
ncbi:MAG: hypothetical protein JSU09_00790 [Bacteroidetes bacterium]|nr:hypothetical protein [Bacteroidota bacterium]